LIIEDDDKYEVKNITDICENVKLIDINFKKVLKINLSSINETIWEDINAIIFYRNILFIKTINKL